MDIRKAPAARGKNWLLEGSDLFARAVISFLLFGLLIQMLTLLMVVPFIGALFVLVLPALIAGALDASRQLDSRKPVQLSTFFGFLARPAERRSLLTLGLFNLLIGVLASLILASSLGALSDGNLLELMQSGDPELLVNLDLSPLFNFLMLLAIVIGLVTALNFFAVPLVAFRQAPPLQAMLTSFRACLVNWASMLVYGLGVMVLFVVVGLLLILIATMSVMLFGDSTVASQVLTLLTIPILIAIQMILLCAQYLAYRDIFGGEPVDSPGDQLLA